MPYPTESAYLILLYLCESVKGLINNIMWGGLTGEWYILLIASWLEYIWRVTSFLIWQQCIFGKYPSGIHRTNCFRMVRCFFFFSTEFDTMTLEWKRAAVGDMIWLLRRKLWKGHFWSGQISQLSQLPRCGRGLTGRRSLGKNQSQGSQSDGSISGVLLSK